MGVGFWIFIALAAVLVLVIVPFFLLSAILYTVLLVRTKPDKWARGCSAPEDPSCLEMYRRGMAWHDRYQSRKKELWTESDGFRLCGEYFDFGADRTVIIVPGRTETCEYSYYYAEPYRAAGWNVLAIDNRSHGLSEGKFNSLGNREYRDLHRWAELLQREHGIRQVLLHGICIGASASLFACESPDCPPVISGMVADGMFETFCGSFKRHMVDGKHPVFPYVPIIMLYIRLFGRANVVTDGPEKRISGMRKPVLFLHSREDIFSLPEKALELYERCPAEKELVWFEHGAHSRLRITDTEKYDAAIASFSGRYFPVSIAQSAAERR